MSGQYNITALFDHELSVGPLDLNLADLGFTKDLQKEFDHIPKILLAMAVIYILAIGFTGLSFFASVAAVALIPKQARTITLANLGIAVLAVLLLLAGNLITTMGAKPAAHKIDDIGKRIGLRAYSGDKFIAMAWAAFALMVVAAGYWGWELSRSGKRNGRVGVHEKYASRHSAESHQHSQSRPQPGYNNPRY